MHTGASRTYDCETLHCLQVTIRKLLIILSWRWWFRQIKKNSHIRRSACVLEHHLALLVQFGAFRQLTQEELRRSGVAHKQDPRLLLLKVQADLE